VASIKMTAYWVGKSIVAAPDPLSALQVIARHGGMKRWQLSDVRELTQADLAMPIQPTLQMSVGEVVEGLVVGSQRSIGFAGSQQDGVLVRLYHDPL